MEAITSPLAREVSQFREAVDHDPGRPQLIDAGTYPLHHLGELDFRGVKEGLLAGCAEDAAQVGEVHEIDAVERPAMGCCEAGQLVERLGERDQKGALVVRHAYPKELESQGCLARAGVSFQQIQARNGQTAGENVIEACDARG